jgi:hypothetical protein
MIRLPRQRILMIIMLMENMYRLTDLQVIQQIYNADGEYKPVEEMTQEEIEQELNDMLNGN